MRFTKHLFASALLSAIAGNAFAVNIRVHHPIVILPTPPQMHQAPYGLSPQQMKIAYGLNNVKARGKGQTIAIIGAFDDPSIEADLGVFDTTFNLPQCTTANGCFRKIYADGTRPPKDTTGWSGEMALDVEWAHAMAPMAKILLVEGKSDFQPDIYLGIKTAIANGANIVSMSWGSTEGSWVKALNLDDYFNVPNVTFVASSGDGGHEVSYPAASPYVLSVGGTSLTVDASGNRLSETAWAGSGGGVSTVESETPQQKAYPIPKDPQQMRGVPDVSYFAAAYSGGAPTGVAVYNTTVRQGETPGWQMVGGTSAGAPQWAGWIARANSVAQKNIPVASIIYKIAKGGTNLPFYDITTGQNGSCGYYCQAQLGYDYVTGLGSPHAKDIIDRLVQGS